MTNPLSLGRVRDLAANHVVPRNPFRAGHDLAAIRKSGARLAGLVVRQRILAEAQPFGWAGRLVAVTGRVKERNRWAGELEPGDHEASPMGREGFDEFFRRHWLAMVRLAGLLVDDIASAEDVAQDAFVAYQRRRETLRSADADVAYLRTCVVNGARSVLRRRAVSRRYAASRTDIGPDSPDPATVAAADSSEVMAAVRRLPRRQREVVVLRYWLDLSHAEVARLLGVSTGTVKSTASRALDALQTLLEEDA